jgi:hypothetical protein
MAISTYGDLKAELSAYMFHQRFVARYDNCTGNFERAANRRLRVRPMEATVLLTTVNGDVNLPDDYLVWRTVRPIFAAGSPDALMLHPPYDEIDYVHPAYLPPVGRGYDRLFTIEGNTFKVRPVDDRVGAYEFHYYQKIPALVAAGTNWLLTEYPNAYLYGVLTELAAVQRNAEMAQLYKARRDETFQEIIQRYAMTTGATSAKVRTAEYY